MTLKKIQKIRLQLLNSHVQYSKHILEISNLGKEIEEERKNGTLTKLKESYYETDRKFLESMLIGIQKMEQYLDAQEKSLQDN